MLARFVVNEDMKMQKILELIVALNSNDQKLVRDCRGHIIET
jgi:hypothetical protein